MAISAQALSACEEESIIHKSSQEKVHREHHYCSYIKQIGCVFILSSSLFVAAFIVGSTSQLPKILSTYHSEAKFTSEDLKWLASLPILIGITGSLFGTFLSNKIGPLLLFRWSQPITAALYLLIAFKPTLGILYFARLGLGFLMGVFDVIIFPLISEITEPNLRGFSSALADIITSAAILVTYVLIPLLPHNIAILCFLIPVLIGYLGSFAVPESPYWLARNGRANEAARTLRRTFVSSEEEIKKLLGTFKIEEESSIKEQTILLRKKQNWKPVLLSASAFILREIGGNSAIMFYAFFIFQRANLAVSAFTCTVLVGVLRLGGSLASSFLHDRIGRRPLLIGTFLVAGIAMELGGLFLVKDFNDSGWVPLVALLICTATNGIGSGPIPFIILGELMPSRIRLVGSGIVLSLFYFMQFTVITVVPPLVNFISLGTTLVLFGFFDIFAVFYLWIFLPETKNLSLIQIENRFTIKKLEESP